MTSERQKKKGWILPESLTGYPMVCVQFQCPDNQYFRAAVIGAVHQLAKWWNWEKSYSPSDKRATQAAAMWREILHDSLKFTDDCAEIDGEKPCKEYPLDSPIFEWNPNDPFRTPDLVPAGYAFPPWYRANSITGVTLGTSPGDIVTDITRTQSIPVIPPASGYPRLRIHLKGPGVVELHLVKLNAGGYVQITTDDDIFSVEICSLDKDVIAIPPESTDDVVIEREIQGSGEHHIDLLFIPKVNDELLPPVKQGGAIRKIVLCGFDDLELCPEPEPCPDCPDPDDIIEDWIDDIGIPGIEFPEDLEAFMTCAMPFIGQLVAGVVPPTSTGWLLCDGTAVSKGLYPELYAVLAGKVTEDAENFNLPDFRDKIPMGAASIVDVLAAAGESAHTLTDAELPNHYHTIAGHSHTTQPHTHVQNAHTHTQNSHSHVISDPGHTHGIPVRQNLSSFGAELIATGANATQNATKATNSEITGISVVAATATNQNATATNQDANVEINDSGVQTTEDFETSNDPFPLIPPVIGVHWFIFSGCKEGC